MNVNKTDVESWRRKLLILFSEMKLSPNTRLAISRIMASYSKSEKESAARELVKKIQECKTEVEVITKLKLNTQ